MYKFNLPRILSSLKSDPATHFAFSQALFFMVGGGIALPLAATAVAGLTLGTRFLLESDRLKFLRTKFSEEHGRANPQDRSEKRMRFDKCIGLLVNGGSVISAIGLTALATGAPLVAAGATLIGAASLLNGLELWDYKSNITEQKVQKVLRYARPDALGAIGSAVFGYLAGVPISMAAFIGLGIGLNIAHTVNGLKDPPLYRRPFDLLGRKLGPLVPGSWRSLSRWAKGRLSNMVFKGRKGFVSDAAASLLALNIYSAIAVAAGTITAWSNGSVWIGAATLGHAFSFTGKHVLFCEKSVKHHELLVKKRGQEESDRDYLNPIGQEPFPDFKPSPCPRKSAEIRGPSLSRLFDSGAGEISEVASSTGNNAAKQAPKAEPA